MRFKLVAEFHGHKHDGPQLLLFIAVVGQVNLILPPNLLHHHFPRHHVVPKHAKLVTLYPFLALDRIMAAKLLQKDVPVFGENIAFELGEVLLVARFLTKRHF